jgi:hypothetical protein
MRIEPIGVPLPSDRWSMIAELAAKGVTSNVVARTRMSSVQSE